MATSLIRKAIVEINDLHIYRAYMVSRKVPTLGGTLYAL